MTTPEQFHQQAELQATQLQAGAQQQQKESFVADALGIAVDVADAITRPGELLNLVASGMRSAASGAADLATGTLDAAGSVVGGAADAAGAVVGGAVDVVVEVVAAALN